MEEKQLISQIIKGNNQAINRFYKIYHNLLIKIILRKVENRKDAEEILQDVFISALSSLPLFNFRSSLLTWLQSITRHEICDYYRKKKIKTIVFSKFPFLEKLVDQALGPELALQEKEMKHKISTTFENLREGYQLILRLKYMEGLSVREISKAQGKSLKAVESMLARARLAFQKEYEKKVSYQFESASLEKACQILPFVIDKRKLSS